MARFVTTSDAGFFGRLMRHWGESGLRQGARLRAGAVCAGTAKKRAIEHTNWFESGEDRWILGVGTYVTYGGAYGAAALEQILRWLDPEDPLAVRNRIFGHYAIAARIGDRIFVFCDGIATYDLYYWIDARDLSRFVLGNFLSDFLLFPEIRPGVSDLDALRIAYHGDRGIGRDSALDGVRSLHGTEFLRVSLDGQSARAELIEDPGAAPDFPVDRFEAMLDRYLAESDRVFSALSSFPGIGMNCTGGLDSRLLVAAARRCALRPVLLYGFGNSGMTNTRAEDLSAVRRIGALYGWDVNLMDWRQARPHDASARRRNHLRYGFKQPYGATAGLLRALEGHIDPYPVLQLGGYSTAFTNLKPWSLPEQDFSMEDFARYGVARYREVFRTSAAEETHVERLVSDYSELRAGAPFLGDGDHLTHAEFGKMVMHAKIPQAVHNLNCFNQFSYYLSPYFTTELYLCLLSVPGRWREGDRFQIEAIRASDEAVLEVPIFSALKRFELDRGTMTMRPAGPRAPNALGRARARVNRALPEPLQRRIVDLKGTLLPDGDFSTRFRRALLRDLQAGFPSDRIDLQALVRKDLRVVYRYLTALELVRTWPQPAPKTTEDRIDRATAPG